MSPTTAPAAISPILNPANFPPTIDRGTSIPPNTTLILAADLSTRNLTPQEKLGLNLGTHILITQDRVNQRFSTWEQIDQARAMVSAAIADERRKATIAAAKAQRDATPITTSSPPLTGADLAARIEHARACARERKQRQRARERETSQTDPR